MVWLPDGEKKFDHMFIRFDRMYECDGHTHTNTDTLQTDTAWRHRPRLHIASRQKNCPKICREKTEIGDCLKFKMWITWLWPRSLASTTPGLPLRHDWLSSFQAWQSIPSENFSFSGIFLSISIRFSYCADPYCKTEGALHSHYIMC